VPVRVIVPEVGAKDLVELTVKAPPTLKEDVGWVVGVSETVRPLKTKVPELARDQPVVAKVIVPEDGLRLAKLPTVKAPFTVKLDPLVTVAELAMVKLLKVRIPVSAIFEPLFIVIVPAEGVKVPLTVNAPPTVAVLVPVVIVPEIVKLL